MIRRGLDRRIPSGFWIAVLALCALSVIFFDRTAAAYMRYFGMYHDDALYCVTAKALAEGQGYRIISLPGEPPQTKYPAGFPCFLAIFWRLFPDFPGNLVILTAVQCMLALAAALLPALYLVATRKATPLLALTLMGACLFNSRYLDFAPMLMSETAFALTAAAAMWATESMARSRRWQAPFAMGAIWSLPSLMRHQGLTLIPAALIHLLMKGKGAAAARACLTAALLAAPFILWQSYARRDIPDFLSFYTNYLGHAYGTLPPDSFRLLLSNWNWSGILQVNTYYPFIERLPYRAMDPLVFELVFRVGYLALGAPLVVGGATQALAGTLPGLYCAFNAALLAAWPVKLEWRHIVPFLILNYYLLFCGYRKLGRWLKPFARCRTRHYRLLCAGASLLFSAYLCAGALINSLQTAGQYGSASLPVIAAFARDYLAACAFIRSNSTAGDTIVAANDPLVFLTTGRKSVFPSRLELWRFSEDRLVDASSLIESIRFARARYVLVDPSLRTEGHISAHLAHAIAVTLRQYPGLLREVFATPDRLVVVYEVDRKRLPPGANVR